MGSCVNTEYAVFLLEAGVFEQHLVQGGVRLPEFWLSVSLAEQRRRFRPRDRDPLKQWMLSPVDFISMDKWDDHTRAMEAMLVITDTHCTPCVLVSSDCRKRARLNVKRHMLGRLHGPHKDERVVGEVGRLLVMSTKNLCRLPVGAPHGHR